MSGPGPAGVDGVEIRDARPGDAETIAAFNVAMALETEDKALDPGTVGAGVRAALADPGHGFYVVAEVDGRVAGALMVTFEWSDWRDARFWWVQSVYVIPEHRGAGVFRRLYEHVRALARGDGSVCGLRLYVEHDNRRAQSVYGALGMHDTGYLVYEEAL